MPDEKCRSRGGCCGSAGNPDIRRRRFRVLATPGIRQGTCLASREADPVRSPDVISCCSATKVSSESYKPLGTYWPISLLDSVAMRAYLSSLRHCGPCRFGPVLPGHPCATRRLIPPHAGPLGEILDQGIATCRRSQAAAADGADTLMADHCALTDLYCLGDQARGLRFLCLQRVF